MCIRDRHQTILIQPTVPQHVQRHEVTQHVGEFHAVPRQWPTSLRVGIHGYNPLPLYLINTFFFFISWMVSGYMTWDLKSPNVRYGLSNKQSLQEYPYLVEVLLTFAEYRKYLSGQPAFGIQKRTRFTCCYIYSLRQSWADLSKLSPVYWPESRNDSK